jgi:hypothetical protein
MTGLVALKSMLSSLAGEDRQVYIISNVPDVTDKIEKKIRDHHIQEHVHFHATVKEALAKTQHVTS